MKITFGGKELELKKLTLNEWVELEESGMDLKKFQKKGTEPTMKELRLLIWVTLKLADPAITIDWVGQNINPLTDAEVFNKIINFLVAKESDQALQN